ncbi:unnamed protein product [Closterium sp. Naga37s-1]|nr:unnamed protein product [Closterium sp. Naga37s-1]
MLLTRHVPIPCPPSLVPPPSSHLMAHRKAAGRRHSYGGQELTAMHAALTHPLATAHASDAGSSSDSSTAGSGTGSRGSRASRRRGGTGSMDVPGRPATALTRFSRHAKPPLATPPSSLPPTAAATPLATTPLASPSATSAFSARSLPAQAEAPPSHATPAAVAAAAVGVAAGEFGKTVRGSGKGRAGGSGKERAGGSGKERARGMRQIEAELQQRREAAAAKAAAGTAATAEADSGANGAVEDDGWEQQVGQVAVVHRQVRATSLAELYRAAGRGGDLDGARNVAPAHALPHVLAATPGPLCQSMPLEPHLGLQPHLPTPLPVSPVPAAPAAPAAPATSQCMAGTGTGPSPGISPPSTLFSTTSPLAVALPPCSATAPFPPASAPSPPASASADSPLCHPPHTASSPPAARPPSHRDLLRARKAAHSRRPHSLAGGEFATLRLAHNPTGGSPESTTALHRSPLSSSSRLIHPVAAVALATLPRPSTSSPAPPADPSAGAADESGRKRQSNKGMRQAAGGGAVAAAVQQSAGAVVAAQPAMVDIPRAATTGSIHTTPATAAAAALRTCGSDDVPCPPAHAEHMAQGGEGGMQGREHVAAVPPSAGAAPALAAGTHMSHPTALAHDPAVPSTVPRPLLHLAPTALASASPAMSAGSPVTSAGSPAMSAGSPASLSNEHAPRGAQQAAAVAELRSKLRVLLAPPLSVAEQAGMGAWGVGECHDVARKGGAGSEEGQVPSAVVNAPPATAGHSGSLPPHSSAAHPTSALTATHRHPPSPPLLHRSLSDPHTPRPPTAPFPLVSPPSPGTLSAPHSPAPPPSARALGFACARRPFMLPPDWHAPSGAAESGGRPRTAEGERGGRGMRAFTSVGHRGLLPGSMHAGEASAAAGGAGSHSALTAREVLAALRRVPGPYSSGRFDEVEGVDDALLGAAATPRVVAGGARGGGGGRRRRSGEYASGGDGEREKGGGAEEAGGEDREGREDSESDGDGEGEEAAQMRMEWRRVRKERQLVEQERGEVQRVQGEVARFKQWAQEEQQRLQEEKRKVEADKQRLAPFEARHRACQHHIAAQDAATAALRAQASAAATATGHVAAHTHSLRCHLASSAHLLAATKQRLAHDRASVAGALARAAEAEVRAQAAERRFGKMPWEVRSGSGVARAVHGVAGRHGSPVQRLHTPAMRLARVVAVAWRGGTGEGAEEGAGVEKEDLWGEVGEMAEGREEGGHRGGEEGKGNAWQGWSASTEGMVVEEGQRREQRGVVGKARGLKGEQVAGVAREVMRALLLAARAASDNASRLLFWWSNTAMLRSALAPLVAEEQRRKGEGKKGEAATGEGGAAGGGVGSGAAAANGGGACWPGTGHDDRGEHPEHPERPEDPWGSLAHLESQLLQLEQWQHNRCLQLVWTRVFLPAMQQRPPVLPPPFHPPSHTPPFTPAWSSALLCATSACQQSYLWPFSAPTPPPPPLRAEEVQAPWWAGLSGTERWVAVMHEAAAMLCPHRAMGHHCGCLYPLFKQVLQQCQQRLDAALFNALLRSGNDVLSTDPAADPLTEPAALPFPANGRFWAGQGGLLKHTTHPSLPSRPIPHCHPDPSLTAIQTHRSLPSRPIPHCHPDPSLTAIQTHPSLPSRPIPHCHPDPSLTAIQTHPSLPSRPIPHCHPDPSLAAIQTHPWLPSRPIPGCHPDPSLAATAPVSSCTLNVFAPFRHASVPSVTPPPPPRHPTARLQVSEWSEFLADMDAHVSSHCHAAAAAAAATQHAATAAHAYPPSPILPPPTVPLSLLSSARFWAGQLELFDWPEGAEGQGGAEKPGCGNGLVGQGEGWRAVTGGDAMGDAVARSIAGCEGGTGQRGYDPAALLLLGGREGEGEEGRGLVQQLIGGRAECFPLLRALAHVLLLPKKALCDRPVRRQVYATIPAPLLQRVVSMCVEQPSHPDPIPPVLLDMLHAEANTSAHAIHFLPVFDPTPLPPTPYRPPPTSALHALLGAAAPGAVGVQQGGLEGGKGARHGDLPME